MDTKTILIVDDDADLTLANRLVLESAGYAVEEAADGATALKKMRANKPDLVLMDVMMATPMDGYHTVQQMAHDNDLSGIPILMISAVTASEYAAQFPTTGPLPIRDFIAKPVAPEALLKKIQRYLR